MTTTTNLRPDPVLGEVLPETGGTIIAWGHVDAMTGTATEQERWCILLLIAPEKRIPNEENYEVLYLYPDDGPLSTGGRIEATVKFPNIVPAVEDGYTQWGMDW